LAAIDPEQSEHDILYALPDSPEPSYSSVAKHIEDTLLGLLDDLTCLSAIARKPRRCVTA
jgi:diguanylate cyclase